MYIVQFTFAFKCLFIYILIMIIDMSMRSVKIVVSNEYTHSLRKWEQKTTAFYNKFKQYPS